MAKRSKSKIGSPGRYFLTPDARKFFAQNVRSGGGISPFARIVCGPPSTIRHLLEGGHVREPIARFYDGLLRRLGFRGRTGLEIIDSVDSLIAARRSTRKPPPEAA